MAVCDACYIFTIIIDVGQKGSMSDGEAWNGSVFGATLAEGEN